MAGDASPISDTDVAARTDTAIVDRCSSNRLIAVPFLLSSDHSWVLSSTIGARNRIYRRLTRIGPSGRWRAGIALAGIRGVVPRSTHFKICSRHSRSSGSTIMK